MRLVGHFLPRRERRKQGGEEDRARGESVNRVGLRLEPRVSTLDSPIVVGVCLIGVDYERTVVGEVGDAVPIAIGVAGHDEVATVALADAGPAADLVRRASGVDETAHIIRAGLLGAQARAREDLLAARRVGEQRAGEPKHVGGGVLTDRVGSGAVRIAGAGAVVLLGRCPRRIPEDGRAELAGAAAGAADGAAVAGADEILDTAAGREEAAAGRTFRFAVAGFGGVGADSCARPGERRDGTAAARETAFRTLKVWITSPFVLPSPSRSAPWSASSVRNVTVSPLTRYGTRGSQASKAARRHRLPRVQELAGQAIHCYVVH